MNFATLNSDQYGQYYNNAYNKQNTSNYNVNVHNLKIIISCVAIILILCCIVTINNNNILNRYIDFFWGSSYEWLLILLLTSIVLWYFIIDFNDEFQQSCNPSIMSVSCVKIITTTIIMIAIMTVVYFHNIIHMYAIKKLIKKY